MGCDHFGGKGPNGEPFEMWICSRGSKAKPCGVTGCRKRSTKLCDFPLSGAKQGKTCDRALCESHAHHVADVDRIERAKMGPTVTSKDSVDYCPAHFEMTRASDSGGTAKETK